MRANPFLILPPYLHRVFVTHLRQHLSIVCKTNMTSLFGTFTDREQMLNLDAPSNDCHQTHTSGDASGRNGCLIVCMSSQSLEPTIEHNKYQKTSLTLSVVLREDGHVKFRRARCPIGFSLSDFVPRDRYNDIQTVMRSSTKIPSGMMSKARIWLCQTNVQVVEQRLKRSRYL